MSTFLERIARRRRQGRHSTAVIRARLRDIDAVADYSSGAFVHVNGAYEHMPINIKLPSLPSSDNAPQASPSESATA